MKILSIVILVAICLNTSISQDQTVTNPFVIGGSINFLIQNNNNPSSIGIIGNAIFTVNSNTSSTDGKNIGFTFRPYIGKQLSNRLFAGVLVEYGSSRYSSTIISSFPGPVIFDFERKSHHYGVGLFTRHSFKPEARFDFFLQPFLQYHLINENEFIDNDRGNEEQVNYLSIGSDMGILFNINEKWRALLRMGGLRYVNGSWEIEDTTEGESFSSFGLNLNLSSIQFGIEMEI